MGARERTRHIGVYARTSQSRMHRGRPDVCYEISYKAGGHKVWEKAGWLSEGYSAALAAQIRAERMRGIRHGDVPGIVNGREMTWGEAWELYDQRWLATSIKHPEDERGIYRRHLATYRSLPLSRLTTYELDRLRGRLLDAGLAAQSILHVLGLVRRVYNRLRAWGLWRGDNPASGLTMPRPDNERVRFLTPDEAARLLAELARRSPDWHCLALLSLHAGLRITEALSLTWGQVDLAQRTLYLPDSKSGTRHAYLTDTAAAALEARPRGGHGELVFQGRGGQAYDRSANTFRRAVASCGLNEGVTDRRQRVVYHTLRHTYASWMVLRGVPLYTVAELLGHSTVEMTRRYAHLSPGHKREALRHIEAAHASADPGCAGPAPRKIPPGPPGGTGSCSR